MAKQTINVGTTANDRKGDSLRAAFQKVNANFTELYTALGLNSDGTLNLGAFEFTGSTISTTDSSGITIDQATTVTSDLTVGGDVVPSVAQGGDLGSSARPWRSLYVSNNTIFIGGNALKIDDNGDLTLNNNRIVQENGEFLVLDNLTDVSALSPSVGDVLAWNGGSWVNAGQATVPTLTSQLTNDSGFLTTAVLANGLDADIKGSVFADDSTLMIDAVDNKIYATELTVAVGNFVNVNSNNVDVENINGLSSQINFTVGGYNNLVIENNLVTIQNVSLSVAGDITLGGDIKSEGNINIDINLADSTMRRWSFGEDGELTFPDGTAQSSAGISASSTDTFTNKTINIQAGQGNVFQIQGNSITSYSGSGAVLALTSMPTFSGMNVNNSSLSIDGGSGSYYANTAFADGAGTIHKAGVYKSANNANNALFTFGANGAGTMSVVMDGSLFIGSALPANNGGLNTDYGGWLVVQAGAKFGGDLNTLGNFILDTPGNYVRFGDGTTQTTAADFGYLDLDKDTIKGTADYQYTFATDGYFTASTSSESTGYFFVTYNATNANIAAGWTVVGGTANTTVSSVTYPVAGYPGVIRVNLTAAASSTSGFYPVTVTSPDRLRVEIQPNPGTSDKFTFTTSGLTSPGAVTADNGAGYRTIIDPDSITAVWNGDTIFSIDKGPQGGSINAQEGKTFAITTDDGDNFWYFGADGNLIIPGDIRSQGNINIDINLSDSTLRRWSFGEDGVLNIPGNISQRGSPGLTIGSSHNVYIVGDQGDNNRTWTFDGTSGDLELPNGTVIADDGSNGIEIVMPTTLGQSNNFVWRFSDQAIGSDRITLNWNLLASDTDTFYLGTTHTAAGKYLILEGSSQSLSYFSNGVPSNSKLIFGAPAGNNAGDANAIELKAPGGDVYLTSTESVKITVDADDSSARVWRFDPTGELTVPGNISRRDGGNLDILSAANLYIDSTNNGSLWLGTAADTDSVILGSKTNGNDVAVLGDLQVITGVYETFSSIADATGVVTHNCANGHIFYHTSPDANWTVNITNLNSTQNRATTITCIISQGGTGYYPNALQIAGAAQTINWQGNTTPTPSTNRTDVVSFSILNTSGGYVVLGQLTGF